MKYLFYINGATVQKDCEHSARIFAGHEPVTEQTKLVIIDEKGNKETCTVGDVWSLEGEQAQRSMRYSKSKLSYQNRISNRLIKK